MGNCSAAGICSQGNFCGMMPHEISVPEVTVCRYFNDSNLIGALYVHLNAE